MKVGSGLTELAGKVRKLGTSIQRVGNAANAIKYPTDDEIFLPDTTLDRIGEIIEDAAEETNSIASKLQEIEDGLVRAQRAVEAAESDLQAGLMGILDGELTDKPWSYIDLKRSWST